MFCSKLSSTGVLFFQGANSCVGGGFIFTMTSPTHCCGLQEIVNQLTDPVYSDTCTSHEVHAQPASTFFYVSQNVQIRKTLWPAGVSS